MFLSIGIECYIAKFAEQTNNFFWYYRYQQGLGKVYVPTHLRLPSWLVGFITGCILVEYPMGTIRIPKVFLIS